MEYKENLNKLEINIKCNKVHQFLWIHDIVEGLVRLTNNDIVITDDDIDPKFKKCFKDYLNKL